MKMFSVPIHIHWSYLFLVGGIIFFSPINAGTTLYTLIYKVLLMVIMTISVLAHELGHVLMARRLGFNPIKIVLFALGGQAHIDMPSVTFDGRRALVTFAGPATNLLLGLIAFLLLTVCAKFAIINVLLTTILVVNVLIGILNLIPIIPLDGGRLFTFALSKVVGHVMALRIVATLSIICGIMVMIASIVFMYLTLFLVAAFLILISYLELMNAGNLE